jgi:aspartyl protease family protein
MSITIKFASYQSLITLPVILKYRFTHQFKFALDTGAVLTLITPQVAEEIGFQISTLVPSTEVIGITGSNIVPKVNVDSITLFNYTIENITCMIVGLLPKLRVDGLLGLNFLCHFNINLNFENLTLTFNKIT